MSKLSNREIRRIRNLARTMKLKDVAMHACIQRLALEKRLEKLFGTNPCI